MHHSASRPLSRYTLMLSRMSSKNKALALLFLAIVVWGGNWPVMKTGLNYISPIWFSMLRFALGGATLFIFQIINRTLYLPKKSDVALILSIALIQMMAFTVLGSIAMQSVDAGRSAVLAYTTSLWVLPISYMLFKERLTKKQMAGALLGGVGVLVLFNPFSFDWSVKSLVLANGMLLAAAFCWGLCIVHLRHSKSKASATQLAPWQMLIATMVLIPVAYWVEGPLKLELSIDVAMICLYLGPLATAFCFCAVNGASRLLSGTFVSTAMLGVPLVGILFSSIFLQERLSWPLAIGAITICLGILMVIQQVKTKNA